MIYVGKERRRWSTHRSCLTLTIALLLHLATVALATTVTTPSATDIESLSEHAMALVKFQWWLIGGAFTLIQLLIGFIYLNGQAATRKQNGLILDKLEKKQDITQCHDLREACANFKKVDK